MSDDLVEGLRLVGRTFMPELMHGSANEIERLRAERDALRARIEGAPVVKVRGRVGELAAIYVSHSLIGKRVALVPVDE